MNLIQKAKRIFKSSDRDSVSLSQANIGEGLRRLLAEAMPLCPHCLREMSVHRYQHIASTPFGGEAKSTFDSMMSALKNHEWEKLLQFQQWEATSADADVYLLGCPDGRFLLVVIYCPYELGDVYKLLYQEKVEASEFPIKTDGWLEV